MSKYDLIHNKPDNICKISDETLQAVSGGAGGFDDPNCPTFRIGSPIQIPLAAFGAPVPDGGSATCTGVVISITQTHLAPSWWRYTIRILHSVETLTDSDNLCCFYGYQLAEYNGIF